jgi:hypothetical protein
MCGHLAQSPLAPDGNLDPLVRFDSLHSRYGPLGSRVVTLEDVLKVIILILRLKDGGGT